MAVALGASLALLYLRGRRLPIVGMVHGLVGASGLALLVATLQGPRRGDAMGVGSFGTAGAALFGAALAFGLCIPLSNRWAHRFVGAVIATHAGLAITAFILFLAWASLG